MLILFRVGGLGPMCGNFGHFFVYAPKDKVETRDYGVARYGMEVQRLCDVLERHLKEGRTYMVGEEYTIADMALFPWFRQLLTGYNQPAPSTITAKTFLSIEEKYPNCVAWANRISERPAVQRGIQVCGWSSPHTKPWLHPKEDESKK
jgi:GST-like protein